MDALKLLTADHNRVRGMFTRFRNAEESDDTGRMTELAPKIIQQLEVHTTIEEEIFYPAVKDASEDVGDLVAEGLQEHHVAKTLIEETQTVDAGGEEWIAKMKVLMENVEHHAKEEEGEMFPQIRSAMDDSKLEQLAQQMEARKKQLGAPTLADKIDLTKQALLEKAKQQEIPGRSKMSQEELAATVDPR